MRVGSTVTCVPYFLCFSTSTCGVSCVELPLFPLCFAASIPCAQTVEISVCGLWAVITFCQLFVKINYVYVRFIAQSFPPFADLITLAGKLSGCTLDRNQCIL